MIVTVVIPPWAFQLVFAPSAIDVKNCVVPPTSDQAAQEAVPPPRAVIIVQIVRGVPTKVPLIGMLKTPSQVTGAWGATA